MPRSLFVFAAVLFAATLNAQSPSSFEVSSVRPSAGPIPGIPPMFGQQRTTPDTLNARHTALVEIIRRAFGVVEQELAGGPDWIRERRFDIVGKSATPASDSELWSMVRPLLEERFKLKYHREAREVSGLALTIGKDGHKLTRSQGGSNNLAMSGGVLNGHNVPMSRLAQILSSLMRRPVTDATRLEGTYDFMVDPRPYAGQGPLDIPGLLIIALQEQLGLKLESRKFELQVMVIDHIELPDEN